MLFLLLTSKGMATVFMQPFLSYHSLQRNGLFLRSLYTCWADTFFFLIHWLYHRGLQASRLGVLRYESQALQKHVYLYGLSVLICKKPLDSWSAGDRQAAERELGYLHLKRSQEQCSVKQTDLPTVWEEDLTRRNADNMGNEVYIYFKESRNAIEEEKGEQ